MGERALLRMWKRKGVPYLGQMVASGSVPRCSRWFAGNLEGLR